MPSRKDEMRLRLQKKLNTSKIDYYITMGNHFFNVPVSMKPDQMAMLERKGCEGRQLLGEVMHLALRDVLFRLPWQCCGCGTPNAKHTFGSPIYVPAAGDDNELEKIVREVYKDDKGETVSAAHIRDKSPMFYCGSQDCLKKVQKAAEHINQRLQQKRDSGLERVKYHATIDGVDFYSLIRLTEEQLAALDGRSDDAAVVLDRCMIPGLKMILRQEITANQPKGGPWDCMICAAVPATEVYGSPMWIPAEDDANSTERLVRDRYRSDGSVQIPTVDVPQWVRSEAGVPGEASDPIPREKTAAGVGNAAGGGSASVNVVPKYHHLRDKAPFFYCGSNQCKQEMHRRIDKVNRAIFLAVKKKLGKDAPKFDPSCCCACCGAIVYQSVKETCPRCRGASYCNPTCREKAWPKHEEDCVPAWKARKSRKKGETKSRSAATPTTTNAKSDETSLKSLREGWY